MKWTTCLLSCLITAASGQETLPVLWMGMDNAARREYRLPGSEEPATLRIPFQISGGLMLVEGEVNGRQGNFIFDTGAPVMLLNDPAAGGVDEILSIGLHQTQPMRKVSIRDFSWAGRQVDAMEAYATDLSHLEDLTQRELIGVIGFEGLQGYELQFDFQEKTMRLRPGGIQYADHAKKFQAPFKMAGHLPVIELTIGGKKFRFGIDSGASVNVLHNRAARACKEYLRDYSQELLIKDINKKTSRVIRTDATQVQWHQQAINDLSFCVADLSPLREIANMPVDGLLGLPFISAYAIAIDFKAQVVYFSLP